MSRAKENSEQLALEAPEVLGNTGDQAAPETPAQNADGDDPKDENPEKETGLLSIEEHAKKLAVGKPILAAVMQGKGWAEGKEVTEGTFKEAVDSFLKAPIGGKK
jgi:hypothetical protein